MIKRFALGGMLLCAIATASMAQSRFVFPVKHNQVVYAPHNIRNPRSTEGGWVVYNGFGNSCPSCPGGPDYPYHPGMDYNRYDGNEDTDNDVPVYAIADGTVIRVKNMGYLGWAILIRHDLPNPENLSAYVIPNTNPTDQIVNASSVVSMYLHLYNNAFGLPSGDHRPPNPTLTVVKGQLLGFISSDPDLRHLHFEIRAGTSDQTAAANGHQNAGYYDSRQAITDFGDIDPESFIEDHVSFVGYFADGWHSDGVSQSLALKYNILATANPPHILGSPWNHGPYGVWVHEQNGMYIQDFNGPDNGFDSPYTSLVRKVGSYPTCLLRDGFWFHWAEEAHAGWENFGAPIEDEGGNPSRQRFKRSDGSEIFFVWDDANDIVLVEDAVNGNQIASNNVTFTGAASSREVDGIYHSGISVTPFNLPISLLNGLTHNGFYAFVNNERIDIPQFVVNGDMTIEVNGCGLPYVTGVTASDDECGVVIVEWDDLPQAQYYLVLRNGVIIADYLWESVNAYSDQTAAPGVIYNYAIQARQGDCISEQSLADQGRRRSGVLAAPSNCAASESECDAIIVSWQDNSNDEDGFYVFRDSPYEVWLVPANSTSFVDTSVEGATYYVQAQNVCGWSDTSNHDYGQIVTSRPPQVQYIWASEDQCEGVLVTWLDVIIETSYRVYRDGSFIGATLADEMNFMDNMALQGEPHGYSIEPVRYNCPGLISTIVTGIRQGPPAAPTNCEASESYCGEVLVTWTDNSDSEAGFRIFRDDAVIDNTGPDATSYHDQNPIGLATYRVRSFDSCNNFADSNSDQGDTVSPPSQVQGVSATDDRCDDVIVTWLDLAGESGYLVYRNGIQVSNVLPTNATSYSDATGDHGIPFQYTVTALSANCEGPQSLADDGQRIACCPFSRDTVWTRTYGTSQLDFGRAIIEREDGGFTLAGWTLLPSGYSDAYVVNTDPVGQITTSYAYGGTYSDEVYNIRRFPGGYALAGMYGTQGLGEEMFLILLNSSGGIQTSYYYGTAENERAYDVVSSDDGGFVLTGTTNSGADYYIVKVSSAGSPVWTRMYGGPYADKSFSIDRTFDGGFVVTGYNLRMGQGQDYWTIRLDANGDSLWSRTQGGTGTEIARSVRQTSDGGYLVFGSTTSFGAGGYDFFLVKMDPVGNEIWSRTYGGGADDFAYDMDLSSTGNIVMSGSTRSFGACGEDMYVVLADSGGDTLCTRMYGGLGNHTAYSCDITNDGGVVLVGVTSGPGGLDFYAIRSAPNCLVTPLTPPNVVVQRIGNDIRLNWTNTNAPAYKVYSSTNPDGPFTTLEESTADTLFVDADITELVKFYIVVSSSTP